MHIFRQFLVSCFFEQIEQIVAFPFVVDSQPGFLKNIRFIKGIVKFSKVQHEYEMQYLYSVLYDEKKVKMTGPEEEKVIGWGKFTVKFNIFTSYL